MVTLSPCWGICLSLHLCLTRAPFSPRSAAKDQGDLPGHCCEGGALSGRRGARRGCGNRCTEVGAGRAGRDGMRERRDEGQSRGPGTFLTPSPDSWEVAGRRPRQGGGRPCCGPGVASRDQGADLEWQGTPRIRSHAEGPRSEGWPGCDGLLCGERAPGLWARGSG